MNKTDSSNAIKRATKFGILSTEREEKTHEENIPISKLPNFVVKVKTYCFDPGVLSAKCLR